MKDLTTYALCYAAVLTAALAAAGLITSTSDRTPAAATMTAAPRSVAVQADGPRDLATLDIPF